MLDSNQKPINKSEGELLMEQRTNNNIVNELRYKGATAVVVQGQDSFLSMDILCLMEEEPLEITKLNSTNKNNGEATELLKIIPAFFKDRIIILKAEPAFETEDAYNRCSPTEYQKKLEYLVDFYEKRGFKNINNFIGYKNGIAMCFANNRYDEVLEKINKLGGNTNV